jgi:MerR family transcriptional regulator, light-induced transcriptional regulator
LHGVDRARKERVHVAECAGMEARVNERVKEDLDTLYNARRVTNVGGLPAGEPEFPSVRRNLQPLANLRLRHSLMGAIKSDILPACREAIFESRGGSVNDNADPFRLPLVKIAGMAAGGAPVSEIFAYLRAQPLSAARKAYLLEMAARRIGEGWCCDNLNFVDVTIAVGRLQSAFRRLSQESAACTSRRSSGTVLIMPAPGEEHVFGLLFVEEMFRAAGWSTTMAMPESPAEWLRRTASAAHDVICISWASEARGEALHECLRAIHKSPRTRVIAGGQASIRNFDRLKNVGVDLVSDSPQVALDFSRRNLLKQHQRETSEATYGG